MLLFFHQYIFKSSPYQHLWTLLITFRVYIVFHCMEPQFINQSLANWQWDCSQPFALTELQFAFSYVKIFANMCKSICRIKYRKKFLGPFEIFLDIAKLSFREVVLIYSTMFESASKPLFAKIATGIFQWTIQKLQRF